MQQEATAHCREGFRKSPDARDSALGLAGSERCISTQLTLPPSGWGEKEEPPANLPAPKQLCCGVSPRSGVTETGTVLVSLQPLWA